MGLAGALAEATLTPLRHATKPSSAHLQLEVIKLLRVVDEERQSNVHAGLLLVHLRFYVEIDEFEVFRIIIITDAGADGAQGASLKLSLVHDLPSVWLVGT